MEDIKKTSEFKIPWKKLIILGLIGLIVLAIYLAVIFNKVSVSARPPYNKEGFVQITDYIKTHGNETIIENDNYKLTFDNKSTTFVVLDKTTNEEWRSNPNTSSVRYLDPLIVYYSGSLGAVTPMNAYDFAIKQSDYYLRTTEDSIEVLYEFGGKKGVDKTDFPEVMADERMQEKILSKLDKNSESYRRVTSQCYLQGTTSDGTVIWSMKPGIQNHILELLYKIFYEECGYTTEDLAYDLNIFGVKYEDIYAYVEVAIRYTIIDDGLIVNLINESIVEKEKFPLVYIDVLPYFGCATTSDTGYTLVPDGSGALIEFNNNRSFALPYNQRIYGKELAINRSEMENETDKINLPLYGMKKNTSGFINIAEEGAEMASIIANVSTIDNPYNQAYYRVFFREGETFKFDAINSTTTILKWTDFYSTSDLTLNIKFVHLDEGSYNGMAKVYQDYLVEKGVLTKKDQTTSLTFDLTLLGGYIEKDNFIGIPYKRVRSLTNTLQVQEIVNKLITDGVNELNVIYKGWCNDGLKPTYMGKVEYDNATGNQKELTVLQEYLNGINVDLYPEVLVNTAYSGSNIDENKQVVRDVFGKVVKNYDHNEAILYEDETTLPFYTLKPTTYEETLNNIIKSFSKTKFNNIAFADFGREMYGSYQKKETFFKTDTLNAFNKTMNNLDFNNILVRNPNSYALKYLDIITDLPTSATNYQIVGLSVPFYQLVLSGFMDYSSKSFNIDDKYTYEWHKMKIIETASNLSMTWSFSSTIPLTETEYSYYYSTYYQNWYDKTINTYQELNNLGIYQTSLVKHQVLNSEGSLAKSTYANGIEIVFNYTMSDYNYNGIIISHNSYKVVKE